MVYQGSEGKGRELLNQALNKDPDNIMIVKSIKNIKRANDAKEEGTNLFKKGDLQAAIDKFHDCLEIDELNFTYNATIYLNIAIALSKLKKNEEALKCLNKAVQLNPEYAKAFAKRGEVN